MKSVKYVSQSNNHINTYLKLMCSHYAITSLQLYMRGINGVCVRSVWGGRGGRAAFLCRSNSKAERTAVAWVFDVVGVGSGLVSAKTSKYIPGYQKSCTSKTYQGYYGTWYSLKHRLHYWMTDEMPLCCCTPDDLFVVRYSVRSLLVVG